MPERPDRGHVCASEEAIRFHEDGHLAAVAAGPVRDPADVHQAVHRPVCGLSCPFAFKQVERDEGQHREFGTGIFAQVGGQAVAQCRHARADPALGTVPAEHLPELPSDGPERTGDARARPRRVRRRDPVDQQREVVPVARRRQRPHVLEPEVRREVVDPPRS